MVWKESTKRNANESSTKREARKESAQKREAKRVAQSAKSFGFRTYGRTHHVLHFESLQTHKQ